MKRTWKPGDVAQFTTPTFGSTVTYIRDERGRWHGADEHGGLYTDRDMDGRPGLSPVIVIDPDDREQVERLADSISIQPGFLIDAVQAALRSLVEPPKCSSALIVKGEHFPCDQPAGHGMSHSNVDGGAIWGES